MNDKVRAPSTGLKEAVAGSLSFFSVNGGKKSYLLISTRILHEQFNGLKVNSSYPRIPQYCMGDCCTSQVVDVSFTHVLDDASVEEIGNVERNSHSRCYILMCNSVWKSFLSVIGHPLSWLPGLILLHLIFTLTYLKSSKRRSVVNF